MVGLNLLKHTGPHFRYSFLILMFHKVSYQGEFSMLRKGPWVLCSGLTVPILLPRTQDPRPATWPCPRNTTAGPVFTSQQPCPATTIPRRFPVPGTGAVLVTCGSCLSWRDRPWLPGPAIAHLGRCYFLCHSILWSYCKTIWKMPLSSSRMLCWRNSWVCRMNPLNS